MKNLLSLLFVLVCLQASSQNVYTKDGVNLGSKKDLVSQCTQGADDAMMDVNGIHINKKKYCSCAMTTLLPELTMDEINEHIAKDDLAEFFTTGKNLEILIKCVEPNMEIEDDFVFDDESKFSDNQKKVAVEICVKGLMNDPEMSGVMNENQALSYCSCAIEGLFAQGITYGELQTADDETQAIFNELVVPCMTQAMADSSFFDLEVSSNDVEGDNPIESVPLVDMVGNGYNVKVSVNEFERYFLIDSGASDVVINSEFERELLKGGMITSEDYRGTSSYILADGSSIECEILDIPFLTVGGYTVKNVRAAVFPDGGLLLGQSFLNKFAAWEIQTDDDVLLLVK